MSRTAAEPPCGAASSDRSKGRYVALNGGSVPCSAMATAEAEAVAAALSARLGALDDGESPSAARRALEHLHAAARQDDVVAVQNELAQGKSIDRVDASGDTMLHVAAKAGAVNVVGLLARSGADTAALGHELQTPLHHAAAAGHLEIVEELLLMGADHHVFDARGRTPHLSALKGGHPAVAAALEDSNVAKLHKSYRERSKKEAVQTLAAAAAKAETPAQQAAEALQADMIRDRLHMKTARPGVPD